MNGLMQKLKGFFSSNDAQDNLTDQPEALTIEQIKPQRFVITVRGEITAKSVAAVQKELIASVQPGTPARGIIRAEGFVGFAPGAAGGMDAIERMYKVDEVVERIAVIAKASHHEMFNMFLCTWMRKSEIRFFTPAGLLKAQAWLES